MGTMTGGLIKVMFDGVEIGWIENKPLVDAKNINFKIKPKHITFTGGFKAAPSFHGWFADLKFTSMVYWDNDRREKRLNAFWSRYCN